MTRAVLNQKSKFRIAACLGFADVALPFRMSDHSWPGLCPLSWQWKNSWVLVSRLTPVRNYSYFTWSKFVDSGRENPENRASL